MFLSSKTDLRQLLLNVDLASKPENEKQYTYYFSPKSVILAWAVIRIGVPTPYFVFLYDVDETQTSASHISRENPLK